MRRLDLLLNQFRPARVVPVPFSARVLAACFFALVLPGSLLMFPPNARAVAAGPGAAANPGRPAGTPAPLPAPSFGIGASDSLLAGGGRFRVVYNWRGDHRFRLIPRSWLSDSSGNTPPQPPPSPACSTITSQVGGSVNVVPVFSTDGGTVSATCNIEISGIFESGTDFGIITTGGAGFTPSVNLEMQGSSTSGVQTRVTNTGTSGASSLAYVSALGGGTSGVISFLEADGGVGTGHTASGLIGTYTSHPLGLVTYQSVNPTARMWIDTSGDVGVGTTSPVAGQGLTIFPAARTSGSPSLLTVTGPSDTTLAASTEANDVNLSLARTVQFSAGALATQRAVYIQAPAYAFTAASTLTTAATVDISGAPKSQSNATITDSYGLNIEAGAVQPAGAVTNAYGLSVNAPTQATNNYAATFQGGNVGIGTASPTVGLEVNGSVKFDNTATNTVNGAVANPSGTPGSMSGDVGMVFHMDGVKYTSLDNLITQQQDNSYFTIYDDCPGGTETLSNDPFHPSTGGPFELSRWRGGRTLVRDAKGPAG